MPTAQIIDTPQKAVTHLRGTAVPKILGDFKQAVVGRKVINAGYLTVYGEAYPFVELDDGTFITAAADDEGNGPGVLKAENYDANLEEGLCQTEATAA